MRSTHILTAITLVVLFSSSGFSTEPINRIEVIKRLEEALRDCDWKARNLTGGPKGKMLLHKRTMEDVLALLRADQKVDSSKLEVALMAHSS